MPQGIGSLVLSGPMFAGKTTAANLLAREFDLATVSAREVLRANADFPLASRSDLQKFGRQLEDRTDGRWLADAATDVATKLSPQAIVIDAARTERQIAAIRNALASVRHIHLTASLEVLRRRFEAESGRSIDDRSFERALAHPTELETFALGREADLILDTGVLSGDELLVRIGNALAL